LSVDIPNPRSVLFVPGNNQRALAKAYTLGADLLVFDLEDSVHQSAKDDARKDVIHAVRQNPHWVSRTLIRTNSVRSSEFAADLRAVRAAGVSRTTASRALSADIVGEEHYNVARQYMIRLEQRDLLDPQMRAELARAARMDDREFCRTFAPVVGLTPEQIA
jgi:hypothetical protein